MSVKKKKISIEGHYERKQKNAKWIWVLVTLLVLVAGSVVTFGIMERKERQELLRQEVEQYFSEQSQDGKE